MKTTKYVIPRKIKEVRFNLWKNISIIDIIIVLVLVLIVYLSSVFFVNEIVEVAIVCLSIVFFLPLVFFWIPRRKGWEVVFILLSFFFKKIFFKEKTSKNFTVEYKKILGEECTFKLENGFFCQILEINGNEIVNFNEEEIKLKLNLFSKLLKTISVPFTILKTEGFLKFKDQNSFYCSLIKKIQQKEKNLISKKKKEGLSSYLNNNHFFEKKERHKTNKFYLFFYSKNISFLKENVSYFRKKLLVNSLLTVKKITDEKTNLIFEDIFTLPKSSKVKFEKDYFICGKTYYKVCNLYSFPFEVGSFWLTNLFKLKGVFWFWNFLPLSTEVSKKNINRAIQNLMTMSYIYRSEVDKRDNYFQLSFLNKILNEVTRDNEILFDTDLYFLIKAQSKNELFKKYHEIKTTVRQEEIKIDQFYFQQEKALSCIIPNSSSHIFFHQEIPSSSVSAAIAFTGNTLFDKKGVFMGRDFFNNLVFFDQTQKTHYRTNGNQLVLGASGFGKSFMVKKELLFQIYCGRKVIIIDPEREYKFITDYFGGSWIDVGEATTSKINPLQVFVALEEEVTNKKRNFLALHFQFLEEFLLLVGWGLDQNEINLLFFYLKKLYQKFNISGCTNFHALSADDYPRFQDLYDFIEEEKLKIRESKFFFEKKLNEIDAILFFLSRFTSGGMYSELWNYHTTVDFSENNNVFVYDLFTLTRSGNKKLICAQIFLVTKYIENSIFQNRIRNFKAENEEWVNLVIDEAHLFIDRDYPVVLNFICQLIKRIRKYHGMVTIITQNLNDFLGSNEIKKHATAIINLSQYLKIMHLPPHDLSVLNEIYKKAGCELTIKNQQLILNAGRGECFFTVSQREHYFLKVKTNDLEQKIISNSL